MLLTCKWKQASQIAHKDRQNLINDQLWQFLRVCRHHDLKTGDGWNASVSCWECFGRHSMLDGREKSLKGIKRSEAMMTKQHQDPAKYVQSIQNLPDTETQCQKKNTHQSAQILPACLQQPPRSSMPKRLITWRMYVLCDTSGAAHN